MTLPITVTKRGVVLQVRLTPNASDNRVEGIAEDAEGNSRLRVRVTAVPEKGKANKALEKLLSRFLGCSKSDLEIVSGQTDRNKNICIAGDVETTTLMVETALKKVM
ncbi:DUF167 domain-containing protein [Sneathiella chinensis]|uniref:UPF0235 protein GCM10007924_31650 n=1 Tax=Sneathiella chinensis TaxID=349750 RepID=A0ABQ5U7Q5_9PROT|nr:DUF167 family protein [Sneathiella chinensis]GLQ07943.1 hypothetical protein GCM10007924_31650 [Sneathiella chinensis]